MSFPSTLKRSLIFLTLIAGAVVGCATPLPDLPTARQQLYFSLELTQDGRKVGSPQLLGFEGRQVVAEKRSPGSTQPDYRLVLRPREAGAGYKEQGMKHGRGMGGMHARMHGDAGASDQREDGHKH